MDEIFTPEQVAGHYSAAMDSVDLMQTQALTPLQEAIATGKAQIPA